MSIKIPRLYSTLNPKDYPSLEHLKAKIQMIANQMSKEREMHIVNEFVKFNSGIHPILTGHSHLSSLAKLLHEKGCSVFSFSPFRG